MDHPFSIHIDAWPNGMPIPTKFAFGQPGTNGPFAPSENLNPSVKWSHPPEGTKSFAIICHDPDVPSSGEDVNQEGKIVPENLARVPFFHWVLVDIDLNSSGIGQGSASQGITARGKSAGQTEFGIQGMNDYTGWFAGDSDMEGVYCGYDGPCPPWNDSIIHHYHFEVFALDILTLNLHGEFSGKEALQAMENHILGRASHMGTYSMNPAVKA